MAWGGTGLTPVEFGVAPNFVRGSIITILSVFVLLEKVAPRGWFVGKVAGLFLTAWGICLLAGSR